MGKSIQVHFLPQLTTPEALRGATVVVIDALRATTTIAGALAAGAREVIPFLEVDEVHARASALGRDQVVLGGERGGQRIDQFDLGNSPSEYTPESVSGKVVLFTTTNGTRALSVCREAQRILLASPLNLSAVATALASAEDVHLVCAGTEGHITREDVLVAGGIVYKLCRDAAEPPTLDDSALLAQAAWRAVVAGALGAGVPIAQRLAEEFQATRGGRNLVEIGLSDDLVHSADVDRLTIVPEFDPQAWRIYLP